MIQKIINQSNKAIKEYAKLCSMLSIEQLAQLSKYDIEQEKYNDLMTELRKTLRR